MKVYIASNFADKDRVKARGKELAALGMKCTSRWSEEKVPHNALTSEVPHKYHQETAVADVDDILDAHVVVLTVPTPEQLVKMPIEAASRGGRTFEAGLQFGLMLSMYLGWCSMRAHLSKKHYHWRRLIIMGPAENVFYHLDGKGTAKRYPAIVQLDTWEEVKKYLVELNESEEK
jgi:hypothetical protein